MLPHHMHRRGMICHGRLRFPAEKLCRTTPIGVAALSRQANQTGATRTTLKKLYLFHMISNEDDRYMKIVALYEIDPLFG
jgi:hypothetical protein